MHKYIDYVKCFFRSIYNNFIILIITTIVFINHLFFSADLYIREQWKDKYASCECGGNFDYFPFLIFSFFFTFYSIMFYHNYFKKNRFNVNILIYLFFTISIFCLIFIILEKINKEEFVIFSPLLIHIFLNLFLFNSKYLKSETKVRNYIMLFFIKLKYFVNTFVCLFLSVTIFSFLYNTSKFIIKYFTKIKFPDLINILYKLNNQKEIFLIYFLVYLLVINILFGKIYKIKTKNIHIILSIFICMSIYTLSLYKNYFFNLKKLIFTFSDNLILSFFLFFFFIPLIFTFFLRIGLNKINIILKFRNTTSKF